MTQDGIDAIVWQAIGGEPRGVSRLLAQADAGDDVLVITTAALLEGRPARLDRARAMATTTRDRQVVAIARAHLEGKDELVDALARDHLADYPDSLIVSWIASAGVARARSNRST